METTHFIITCPHCGARNRIPRPKMHDHPLCGRCRHPLSFLGKIPAFPLEVTDNTFEPEVLSFPGPVVVHGYGPRCGYSRQTMPVLAQLARDYADRVKFTQLNVEKNPLNARRYSMSGTPTLLFFRAGRLVNRQVGALPGDQIENLIGTIL